MTKEENVFDGGGNLKEEVNVTEEAIIGGGSYVAPMRTRRQLLQLLFSFSILIFVLKTNRGTKVAPTCFDTLREIGRNLVKSWERVL